MKLVVASFALVFLGSCIAGEAPSSRVPVLLELFTSEGCSSCPPADRLLEELDAKQPVSGADLIVLSEHVDYWNQLGWKDPFSSALFSDRQRQYARGLGGEVYTPELVVDGSKGFVGSDEREAGQAVKSALRTPKTPIRIEVHGNKAVIHMDHAPEGSLYIALAHDSMKSKVTRGENSGRDLAHVAVVYSIEKVARLDKREGAFDQEFSISPKAGANTRVVAFVEKPEMGRVIALGQARL